MKNYVRGALALTLFKGARPSAVVLALVCMATLPSLADTPKIATTIIDYTANQITITGEYLAPQTAAPTVVLNGVTLAPLFFNSTTVVATMPSGLCPGSYTLALKSGKSIVNTEITTQWETGMQRPNPEATYEIPTTKKTPTSYIYQGSAFTAAQEPYTTGQALYGIVTLPAAIPANTCENVGGKGSPPPKGLVFSDGMSSINFDSFSLVNDAIDLCTDSKGTISSWNIRLEFSQNEASGGTTIFTYSSSSNGSTGGDEVNATWQSNSVEITAQASNSSFGKWTKN
jgi:hypothetical protein